MNLKKTLLGAIAFSFIFAACDKKPDYIAKSSNGLRIEYEKMSNCKYYSREDLENELQNYYSGAGVVSLFFGRKRVEYKDEVSGAWQYGNRRFYISGSNFSAGTIVPMLNPKNKKPECFPILNVTKKTDDGYEFTFSNFVDEEFLKEFYPQIKKLKCCKLEKVCGGIYSISYADKFSENRKFTDLTYYTDPNLENSKKIVLTEDIDLVVK
jgi:hypothetical protein